MIYLTLLSGALKTSIYIKYDTKTCHIHNVKGQLFCVLGIIIWVDLTAHVEHIYIICFWTIGLCYNYELEKSVFLK